MFPAKIQSQGLPGPNGATIEAQTTFEFSFCLALENGNRWLMGIAAIREDRVLYLPQSEAQGRWIDGQADLMIPSGMELSWWFRNACAAFEFVERLGSCLIGPSLQERFVAEGGDIIAPPAIIAEEMLARSLAALEERHHALAFDLATRLLVGEGFRPRARRIRECVLTRFGCIEDARREREILGLLGDKELPSLETRSTVSPPIAASYQAVAIELQGLPLDYPAVENALVRYLFRIDVPRNGGSGPWLVRLPELPSSTGNERIPELAEQETWLHGANVRQIGEGWALPDESAQEGFIRGVQNGLAVTDRWGLLHRIKQAQT